MDPASALRLVRLRGKGQVTREALMASAPWQQCRESLERCMEAAGAEPQLSTAQAGSRRGRGGADRAAGGQRPGARPPAAGVTSAMTPKAGWS